MIVNINGVDPAIVIYAIVQNGSNQVYNYNDTSSWDNTIGSWPDYAIYLVENIIPGSYSFDIGFIDNNIDSYSISYFKRSGLIADINDEKIGFDFIPMNTIIGDWTKVSDLSTLATASSVSDMHIDIGTIITNIASLPTVTDINNTLTNSHGSGSWQTDSGTGTGDITVNHNTGGTDNLRYIDEHNVPIDNANILVYNKSDYDAGSHSSEFILGSTTTKSDGRWSSDIYLDSGSTYTIVFYKQGFFGPDTVEITI